MKWQQKNSNNNKREITSPKGEVHVKYFISRNIARKTKQSGTCPHLGGGGRSRSSRSAYMTNETLSEKINLERNPCAPHTIKTDQYLGRLFVSLSHNYKDRRYSRNGQVKRRIHSNRKKG